MGQDDSSKSNLTVSLILTFAFALTRQKSQQAGNALDQAYHKIIAKACDSRLLRGQNLDFFEQSETLLLMKPS
jgi:hypothetical protein